MRKVTENEKMVFEFIKDRIEEAIRPQLGRYVQSLALSLPQQPIDI